MNQPDRHTLQRLATLQTLAAQQEDTAARQLADALAKHANAQDRYAELLEYEAEYAFRTPTAGGVMALSHHAGFLSKLRDAMRFQSDRVQGFAAEVERLRGRWMGLHREVEKLEQLGCSARQQMAVVEARKQSREIDDFAQRSWVRQQAVSG